MILTKHRLRRRLLAAGLLIYGFMIATPASVFGKELSDAEIAKELVKENNKVIIEEFLKYELGEVNAHVTKPLLKNHPSLEFFIKQAERGPLNNLLFLETSGSQASGRTERKHWFSPIFDKLSFHGKEENSRSSCSRRQNYLLWNSSHET